MELEQGLEEAFMNSVRIGDDIVPMQPLKPMATEEEFCMSLFAEGISLLLSQWTTLQCRASMEGGMNGRDRLKYVATGCWRVETEKLKQFYSDIFIWFTQSKEPHEVLELTKFIHTQIGHIFETQITKDVSTVADQLINMHRELSQGKYESIEKLRQAAATSGAILAPPSSLNKVKAGKSPEDKAWILLKIKAHNMKMDKNEKKRKEARAIEAKKRRNKRRNEVSMEA